MKTRIIFLVLLIVCFSCGTNNKPLSDAQKEKITGEVKDVVNTIFKYAEDANFDMAIEPWLDSSDFIYASNGNSFSYKEFVDVMKPAFSTILNQKMTMVSEKYAVIDNATVLYTTESKFMVNFKDGHSILQDPWMIQFIFKKIDSRWRVIFCAESGVEQRVKNKENPNQLNQVELINQILGSWKYEYGKDTTGYADFTIYWTGLDAIGKLVSKGKTIRETRINWAYDKSLDLIIGLSQIKGEDIASLLVSRWISKDKYVIVPYKDISNLEEASMRTEGTLKSHDLLEIIYYENNKPVNTIIYTRVK